MVKTKTKKYHRCSRCYRKAGQDKICIIDGKPVCLICLYGETKPFKIYPIGMVRNDLTRAKKGFGTIGKKEISRIELFESQKPFLYKLEEEKIITIVYYLHEAISTKSVFNRGLDGKKVGVFASRTPYRLSKIGIQDVKLLKIEGATLYVEGLDAIDKTPVLDIKMRWNPF
jgi:tRNA (Thr-GGU) A37 N-methylase